MVAEKRTFFCNIAKTASLKSNLPTIGIDFKVKALQINNYMVKLQIWDTAGQERFRSITNAYYRGASAVLLVFDLTSEESFDKLKTDFYQETLSNCNEGTTLIVVGCKSDLQDQRRVSFEEGS